MTAPWREEVAEAHYNATAWSGCAGSTWEHVTDQHRQDHLEVADALAPMLARWLAEEREGIARAIEGHACNGSPESCDDALAGAPCPYDDAASIARNYRQEKADV